MNICVITGLYPTEQSSSGGVFIHERLMQLRKQGIPYKIYAVEKRYSPGAALIYRLAKRKSFQVSTIVSWDQSDTIIPLFYYVNIFDMILSHLHPRLYHEKILEYLSDKLDVRADTIIHVHWVYPQGYYGVRIAKHYGVPCVITAHGSDIHTDPQQNRLIRKTTLAALSSADRVIFVSQALLNSAKTLGYEGNNAIVIPNGIDSVFLLPVNRETAVKKTGWQRSHKYVVGFVGNLVPVKRADAFPKIFHYIHETMNDVEFVLVGKGILESSIKEQCGDLQVTFTGMVPHDDVLYWMNLFDVLILPSRNEGWGCVISEAYACGIPVVGSDAGGIPEAMGGLGVVVPEGDDFEKRFAGAVCEVLNKNHVSEKQNLIDTASRNTWEQCIMKEIGVYKSLLDSKEKS